MITPPKNKELFETEIATYWFAHDGLLTSVSKNPTRTVANTTESFELIRRITNGKKQPLLVYMCPSGMPDKATRDFVAANLPTVYTAMAMVSKGGLGTMVMNILFKFKPPAIPMKSFNNDTEAKAWLERYR